MISRGDFHHNTISTGKAEHEWEVSCYSSHSYGRDEEFACRSNWGSNSEVSHIIISYHIMSYHIYSPSVDLYRYGIRHTVYISMQGVCHNTTLQ